MINLKHHGQCELLLIIYLFIVLYNIKQALVYQLHQS